MTEPVTVNLSTAEARYVIELIQDRIDALRGADKHPNADRRQVTQQKFIDAIQTGTTND